MLIVRAVFQVAGDRQAGGDANLIAMIGVVAVPDYQLLTVLGAAPSGSNA